MRNLIIFNNLFIFTYSGFSAASYQWLLGDFSSTYRFYNKQSNVRGTRQISNNIKTRAFSLWAQPHRLFPMTIEKLRDRMVSLKNKPFTITKNKKAKPKEKETTLQSWQNQNLFYHILPYIGLSNSKEICSHHQYSSHKVWKQRRLSIINGLWRLH